MMIFILNVMSAENLISVTTLPRFDVFFIFRNDSWNLRQTYICIALVIVRSFTLLGEVTASEFGKLLAAVTSLQSYFFVSTVSFMISEQFFLNVMKVFFVRF